MYSTALLIHSWVRWAALVAGFGATFAAYRGEESTAEKWGLFLMMALDIQMLVGLMLYLVLSPNMREILAHFSESMQGASTRFWAVEHVTAMFGAVVLVHVGRLLARSAATPGSRRVRLMTCFGVATILMLAGMPWPGRPGGRPLFRV
jgi:hypothetical protein